MGAADILFIGILHADVRQQTGQQRSKDPAIFRRLTVDRQAALSPPKEAGRCPATRAHAVVKKIDLVIGGEPLNDSAFCWSPR